MEPAHEAAQLAGAVLLMDQEGEGVIHFIVRHMKHSDQPLSRTG